MIWTIDEYRAARRDIVRRAQELNARQDAVDRDSPGTCEQARGVVATHAAFRALVVESNVCERRLLALLVPPSTAVH